MTPGSGQYAFGDVVLDVGRGLLRRGDTPISLRPKSWDLLHYFVTHADRLIGKDELMSALWPRVVVTEDSLTRCIFEVREALGDMGRSAIQTLPRRGYRFVLPVQAIEAAAGPRIADAPRADQANAAAPPNNLPLPRTQFIGRRGALDDCLGMLQRVRLLTLTGVGGCGKTRMSLRLAEACIDGFADGAWFVDFSPLQDGARVAAAVAAVLDVKEEAGIPSIDRIRAHLLSRRCLLVLDNCEHLVEAVAALADGLLSTCAGLKVIATSRERLRVPGEQVYALEPLSLPQPGMPITESCDAVALFVDRARLALPGFALDACNADAVARICCRLDGIALAIELAAARVDMLSVDDIAARLSDRFRFLTGGNRMLERHQTLHTALQWSHDSLTAAQQRLLRELAVFSGGCSLDAATAVCGDGDEAGTLDRLTALHDKSLLVVDRASRLGSRYRLLETVRQYAHEQLDASAEALEAKTRHLQHFVALAERAATQLQGPSQGEWMARLRLEQDNLLAVHAWCSHAPGGDEAGLRLVGSLWRYWLGSAQLEQGHALAQAALARAAEGCDAVWHCRATVALGTIAFRMGRYAESMRIADRSVALARTLDDAESLASALSLRAKSLHSAGRLPEAVACNQEACEVARSLGPNVRLSAALNNLAELHRSLDQVAEAERCYEESIAITRKLGYAGGGYVALCNLARLLLGSGRLERARTTLLESLEIWSGAGLPGLGKDLIEGAAGLAAKLGDDAMAARLAGAARARLEEAGIQREPVDEAFLAPLLAAASSRMGEAAFMIAQAQGRALAYDTVIAEIRRWLVETPETADARTPADTAAPMAPAPRGRSTPRPA